MRLALVGSGGLFGWFPGVRIIGRQDNSSEAPTRGRGWRPVRTFGPRGGRVLTNLSLRDSSRWGAADAGYLMEPDKDPEVVRDAGLQDWDERGERWSISLMPTAGKEDLPVGRLALEVVDVIARRRGLELDDLDPHIVVHRRSVSGRANAHIIIDRSKLAELSYRGLGSAVGAAVNRLILERNVERAIEQGHLSREQASEWVMTVEIDRRWRSPATTKQREYLERNDRWVDGMSFGHASDAIADIKSTPSPKQRALLERHGRWHDWYTKADASAAIDRLVGEWNRRRQERNQDHALER